MPDETKTIASPDDGSAPALSPLPGPHLDAGATIGRYVVLYRIGTGGMAVVYAAYDPELDRKVALKILRSDLEAGDRQEISKREARAMARLRHANVVAVHDIGEASIGEAEKATFLAMELIDGRDLRRWLSEEKPDWREILELFLQAGRGLAAAHAEGLLHLDFKPSNVMVTRDGQARVTDFGLAQPVSGSARPDHLGTPAYLAPERWQGEPPDSRSDQFSFCTALYQALFAQAPFVAADGENLEAAMLDGQPAPPPAGHGVPPRIVRALERGLRAERSQRFADLDTLLAELAPGERHRGPLAAFLLVAVLAALLGSTIFLPREAKPCSGARAHLAGVWDEEVRGQVRQAFARTDLPFAGETLRWVEARLDRYSRDWAEMYADACEATHVRGEQSERLLDRRMLCLDERLAELRAQTAALARVEPSQLTLAGKAVADLHTVQSCGDRLALDRLVLPELDDTARAELAEAQAKVSAQRVAYRVGERPDEPLLEKNLGLARRLGFRPLEARILQLQSYLRYQEGHFDASRQLVFEALGAAKAAADGVLETRLLAELAEAAVIEPMDFEGAGRWLALSEATLAALGPGHETTACAVEQAAAWVAWHAGDFPEAERRLRRALELGEKAWGRDDIRLASIFTDLGNAIQVLGDPHNEAIGLARRSVELREQAFGSSNPKLGPSLASWAAAQAEAGEYEHALATIERAIEITRDFHGDDYWELFYPTTLRGQILLSMDRPSEATIQLDKAHSLGAGKLGPEHPAMVPLILALAEARLLERRFAEAEELAAEAAAIEGPDTIHHQAVHALLVGRLHLDRGDFATAERWLRRVPELSVLPLSVSARVSLAAAFGTVALGQGQLEQADAHFKEAIEIGQGRDPHLVGEARFGLARVLAAGGDRRADELAARALDELAGSSPRSQALRAAIERFRARSHAG